MKLLLARHGQSQWQVDRENASGNSPLTDLGIQQAHYLGAYLRQQEAVDVIYASDLIRAMSTAEIIASYLELPVNIEPSLREYTGWNEGWAPEPRSMWDPTHDTELAPGYQQFCQRLHVTLQTLLADQAEDSTVLLVAHGGSIGVMLRAIIGSATLRLWTWNTALHKAEWNRPGWGVTWVLHYLNRLEHLPYSMRTS